MIVRILQKAIFKFSSEAKRDSNRNAFEEFLKQRQKNHNELTPREIVEHLDGFVIGQQQAKRAVAISIRNRWRRKMLHEDIKKQVLPKNILISGPTGCGKTQIARRLAKMTNAPFIRVEATKFTEVGYVGKDVSSIIQDTLGQVRRIYEEMQVQQEQKIEKQVLSDLADAMLGRNWEDQEVRDRKINDIKLGRYKHLNMAIYPKEFKIGAQSPENAFIQATLEEIQYSLFQIYIERNQMQERNVSLETEALKKVEEEGIVFIDEIDKLAVGEGERQYHRSISREGVQRDLLPIIEGTTVSTAIGDICTDNILFIVSGAFLMTKVEDLLPQLLGRLPIRVAMNPISQSQFVRILRQPKYNLLLQQKKLLETQKIKLNFTSEGIEQIARFAYEMNQNGQNMGARRLQSIVEKIMEDISFEAPNYAGQVVEVDGELVRRKLGGWDDKLVFGKYMI